MQMEDDGKYDLFFKELRNTSKSTVLVAIRNFNLPEVNREHHTAGTKDSSGLEDS